MKDLFYSYNLPFEESDRRINKRGKKSSKLVKRQHGNFNNRFHLGSNNRKGSNRYHHNHSDDNYSYYDRSSRNDKKSHKHVVS